MNQFQLVCIFSIIAIAYAGGDSKENEEIISEFVEECQKETKASDEDVELFEADEFPKTKTQYCLTGCYYKKMGIMNDDNTMNIDKVLNDFADFEKENKETYDKLVKVIKECHSKYTPVKECDSVKTYTECMLKSAKEAGVPLEK